MVRRIGPVVALLGAVTSRAHGQHSVFRPVPHDSLRELTTDRPDKTESPITVDAGHAQIELDGLTWTLDRPVLGTVVRQWSVAPINMKIGLLDRLDVQLVLEPSTHEETRVAGLAMEHAPAAFGDITGRVKLNFWGDDGGKTAFGIMPFVTATPMGDHRVAVGGLILPFSVSLGESWDLGTMVEGDLVADDGLPGRRGVLVTSVTVGHALSERFGAYAEFYNEVSRHIPWVATVDAGLTFSVGRNIQFDSGINVGVTHAADDVNPFVGFSIRF